MAEDEYESLYEKWKNFDWQDWVDRFGVEIVDAMPEGWRLWEGCLMTPKGYEWIFNGKSILKRGEHQSALLRTGGGHCLRSAKGSPGANEKNSCWRTSSWTWRSAGLRAGITANMCLSFMRSLAA